MSISFPEGQNRIRFSGRTDVGKVRSHNEDNLLIPSDMPLAAVSDGMGGHACGEVASQIAVQTLEEYYRQTNEGGPPNWPFRLPGIQVERDRMTMAIKLANARIFEAGQNDASKKGMGCTVDGVFFSQGRIYVGHVGDSRVYRIRGERITLLTEDHSLLNDYRRMKDMTHDEIENFAHKNVVVRALGLAEQVFVDLVVEEYERGDLYLLCSDGLCGMLDDPTMMQIALQYTNLDTASSQLVQAANDAGGVDNITAVLARVEPG